MKKKHLTKKEFEAVKTLLEAGVSSKWVAERRGLSYSTVNRIKKSLDYDHYKLVSRKEHMHTATKKSWRLWIWNK